MINTKELVELLARQERTEKSYQGQIKLLLKDSKEQQAEIERLEADMNQLQFMVSDMQAVVDAAREFVKPNTIVGTVEIKAALTNLDGDG